jgi:hypothetical protein
MCLPLQEYEQGERASNAAPQTQESNGSHCKLIKLSFTELVLLKDVPTFGFDAKDHATLEHGS